MKKYYRTKRSQYLTPNYEDAKKLAIANNEPIEVWGWSEVCQEWLMFAEIEF